MKTQSTVRAAPSHTLSQAAYFRAMDKVCAPPLTAHEALVLAGLKEKARTVGVGGKDRGTYSLLCLVAAANR